MDNKLKHDPVARVYDYLRHECQREHDNYYTPKPKRFRASEAGDCPRKMYYRLSGEKPDAPFSTFGKIITHDGDVGHDIVRWQMRMAGVEMFDLDFNEETGEIVETNAKVVPVEWGGQNFEVTYRADGGVVIDGVPHSLEIKTIDGFSYKYLEQAYEQGRLWEYMNSEKKGYNKYRKYFLQSAVTATLSGLSHVYLVIKNRSLGQIGFHEENAVLQFEVNPDDYKEAMDGFAMVAEALDKKEIPMAVYSEKSKPCSLCQFKKKCWGR